MTTQKISPIQRDVITAVQLSAKQPVAKAARLLGIRVHSLRYHLSILEERGLIKQAAFLNLYPLGYRYVNLYFSLSAASSALVDGFLQALVASPKVTWLAELGADFQFGVSLLVREMEEVRDFLNDLSKRFPDIFFEKSYVFHLGLSIFPSKYLSAKKLPFPDLGYRNLSGSFNADGLDERILAVMSEQYLTSGRAVARAIGHPHATVELRMRAMERAGVIAGYWYLFDATKLGYQTLKLLIYGKGHQFALAEQLSRFGRQHPNISYFIECLGSWDFELGMDVEDPSLVGKICREILTRFGAGIHNLKVVPMFRVLKWKPFALQSERSRAEKGLKTG